MDKERIPFKGVKENTAIRSILEGTSSDTGEKFFHSLVINLSKVLNTYGAWVTEYLEEQQRLRARAFYIGKNWVNDFEYSIIGTPCEIVIHEHRLVHVYDKLFEIYKGNPDLIDLGKSGAVSYIGVPLEDINGKILGHLSVIDKDPIPQSKHLINVFKIFANRASAELQRLRAEQKTHESEKKLKRIVDSAMDGIAEFDESLEITHLNPAARKILNYRETEIKGKNFKKFIAREEVSNLLILLRRLSSYPGGDRHFWVPTGLSLKRPDGKTIKTEATLSLSEMHGKNFYTLIFRNINDRLEAEEKINALTFETEYLKEELKSLQNFGNIKGSSKAVRKVIRDIKQVCCTDSTVLILGETGTGKELIARAIHSESRRSKKPLIKVNCAAIPASLIESEFFGHEKGAFTGATSKREGRFRLADSGTIFLDEIGELPLELQSKLLRVLQEGEFEPLGSSMTIKVNVRVIAATNKDLQNEIKNGSFREDLYYRLNVFPINVPPLRERGEDVIELAEDFISMFSNGMGKHIEPITRDMKKRLLSYQWPGNVRELQNVIERAVITSNKGVLNLDSSLSVLSESYISSPHEYDGNTTYTKSVKTLKEIQQIEKENILLALKNTNWKIAGKNGAAALLGIPTSTLNSKLKALGINRKK